ncbi:MAG: cytochrome P450 [Longimicrobiales bacterium]
MEPRIAHAGLFAIARLLGQLGIGRFRSGFDAQAAGCQWARAAMAKQNATDLRIGIAGKSVDLVGSRQRSETILSASPDGSEFIAGTLKTGGMSFLAPHALTIQNDANWSRLRRFNEEVLGTGGVHAYGQAFLARVRSAFDLPVTGIEEIRAAMGRVMTGIVFGVDDATLVRDVNVLIGVVHSPVKRNLFGFRYRSRRERLYHAIAAHFDAAETGAETLLAFARLAAGDLGRDVVLQQVPHWMFTFTGSGTDLLARALALIVSRPSVRGRVLDEMAVAGAPDRAETIERLPFLDSCLLETGRLFTPVTRTFHHGRANGDGRGDIVHYFPLLQRDDALGATVHNFEPERWLGAERDAPAAASNLFLRGPRACPGRDLIRFVCRAALARLLTELRVTGGSATLARDPLPLSFPEREARFTVAEATP